MPVKYDHPSLSPRITFYLQLTSPNPTLPLIGRCADIAAAFVHARRTELKDVNAFIAELHESRLRAQAAARAGFLKQPDLSLPPDLEVAIEHQLPIAPMPALSLYAPRWARVGVPSSEREQIEYWYASYGTDTNWVLELSEQTRIIAIRMGLGVFPYLFLRRGEYQSLERTLRVESQKLSYALLAIPPGARPLQRCARGLYWKTLIPLPPSRVVLDSGRGVELAYHDPRARLLVAPESILTTTTGVL